MIKTFLSLAVIDTSSGIVSPSFKSKDTCRELKKSIKNELIDFYSKVKDLADASSKQQIELAKVALTTLLKASSTFYVFKRGAIKSRQDIKAILDEHDLAY